MQVLGYRYLKTSSEIDISGRACSSGDYTKFAALVLSRIRSISGQSRSTEVPP